MKTRSPMAFWLLLGGAAYLGAAVIGVQTARQAHEWRALFRDLAASQSAEDDHLREYRLLLLERATLAGYQNVERLAQEQLGMRFPEQVVKVRR